MVLPKKIAEQAKPTAELINTILDLKSKGLAELRELYESLYHFPTTNRSKPYLVKRCAWKIQENQSGGLSERAKMRIKELEDEALAWFRSRGRKRGKGKSKGHTTGTKTKPTSSPPRSTAPRDSRLPPVGTVLTKEHVGVMYEIEVLTHGFLMDGRPFKSLSAIATQITGTKWNGYSFFGLNSKSETS